jgi:hypothetical protein
MLDNKEQIMSECKVNVSENTKASTKERLNSKFKLLMSTLDKGKQMNGSRRNKEEKMKRKA